MNCNWQVQVETQTWRHTTSHFRFPTEMAKNGVRGFRVSLGFYTPFVLSKLRACSSDGGVGSERCESDGDRPAGQHVSAPRRALRTQGRRQVPARRGAARRPRHDRPRKVSSAARRRAESQNWCQHMHRSVARWTSEKLCASTDDGRTTFAE